MGQKTCMGCKVVLPAQDDVEHYQQLGIGRYGVASSECLAIFNDVLAKEQEYGLVGEQALAIHAYAVQHPPHTEYQQSLGISSRLCAASRQSVIVHLLALYTIIKQKKASKVIDTILSSGERLEDLQLKIPENMGNMQVIDVIKARNKEEYIKLMEAWMFAAWNAWEHEHEMIRILYEKHAR